MAVIPISLARVSQNLRSFNLLETVQRNTRDLFRVQNQLATGLKVARSSDDPISAASVGTLDRRLELIAQLKRNLLHVNNVLTEGESAMQDAVELLMQVQTIASETVSDTSSPDERSSLARVVDSVLDQLVNVGNRRYLSTYLFAGNYQGGQPFAMTGDGVVYYGDFGQARTLVDTDLSEDFLTLSGAEFFKAVSTGVRGAIDLNPALTLQTRISELRGTTGRGVELGRILVSDGTQEVQIDLSGADTVGDLVDKLNAEMPDSLEAQIDAQGITIVSLLGGGTPITIRDAAGGRSARDLGIAAEGLLGAAGGADLDPVLTLRTRLTDLNAGAGINLSGGLTIRNGSRSVSLDFSTAETIEDVLNLINLADVGVCARVADDGRRVEVLNRISGSDLTIEENGGSAATSLGIRSLHGGTLLSSLNDGRGIETVEGSDIRVTTADGTSFEVDLDGAATLQDVIDRLNAAGGGAITAALAAQGNGLVITDNTVGAGVLRLERANYSPALDGLGLDQPVIGNTLTGRDVNPVRTDSAFTALVELRDALRTDDRQAIAWAGQRLENALKRMQEVQGQMAAHAKAMDWREQLVEDEELQATLSLSEVRDVDVAEAVVRFGQFQTALQANLATASRVMNLSLIDFLR